MNENFKNEGFVQMTDVTTDHLDTENNPVLLNFKITQLETTVHSLLKWVKYGFIVFAVLLVVFTGMLSGVLVKYNNLGDITTGAKVCEKKGPTNKAKLTSTISNETGHFKTVRTTVSSTTLQTVTSPNPTPTETEDTCPMGFTRFGSKCYRVFDVKASWIEAKMYCRILGGDLAVIDDVATHKFVQQLVSKVPRILRGYWLDGSDLPYLNNWYWMGKNDTTHKQFAYYNWYSNQPNDHNTYSTCMGVWKDFMWLWHDIQCSWREGGFICQA